MSTHKHVSSQSTKPVAILQKEQLTSLGFIASILVQLLVAPSAIDYSLLISCNVSYKNVWQLICSWAAFCFWCHRAIYIATMQKYIFFLLGMSAALEEAGMHVPSQNLAHAWFGIAKSCTCLIWHRTNEVYVANCQELQFLEQLIMRW